MVSVYLDTKRVHILSCKESVASDTSAPLLDIRGREHSHNLVQELEANVRLGTW